MNNTQTPNTMTDLEYYSAALARFEAQPIGRAKLYLKSTLDGFQRANDPAEYIATGHMLADAQANLRDFLKFGETSDISEFAAWVETTIKCEAAFNAPVYICDELRREAHFARKQSFPHA